MKKRWQIFLYLLFYIFLLAFVMEFDVKRLLDVKGIFIFLTGSLFLTLPFCRKEMEKEELFFIFGGKAVEAGLLQTFLLLFIRLSDVKGSAELLPDIALCFRPMLYAFCLKFTFVRKETGVKCGALDGACVGHKGRQAPEVTYEDCIAAGLTKREAEVACLVCHGCSNGMIAEELVISETTVKKHMSNIFEKTGIKRREELRDHILKCRPPSSVTGA